MKKRVTIGLLALSMVLLTGCGEKKVTCSKESEIGNSVEINNSVDYVFKKGYLTKSTRTFIAKFKTETAAETFVKNYEDQKDYKVELDGTTAKVTHTEKVEEASKEVKK